MLKKQLKNNSPQFDAGWVGPSVPSIGAERPFEEWGREAERPVNRLNPC